MFKIYGNDSAEKEEYSQESEGIIQFKVPKKMRGRGIQIAFRGMVCPLFFLNFLCRQSCFL